MASAKQQLIQDIKDLESALKSEYTPANLKDDLRSEISKSKKQLEDLEEAEKKAQSKKPEVKKKAEQEKKSALQKVKERLQRTKTAKKKVEKKQVQAKKDEKPTTKRTPVKKSAPKKVKTASSKNERDASRKALKAGWRKSRETGEWYYESRANRSDIQRKKYPYLEDGGTTDFTNEGAGMFEKGGIFGSNKNLSRDRMFKSQQKWEQDYKRKTSPKNPRYKYEQGGEFNEGAGMFEGGGILRMYRFLKIDLEKLEKAIKENDTEEINSFFSYWGIHLESIKTQKNERMWNFMLDDLKELKEDIKEGDKEGIDKFFSYWTGSGGHIESLKKYAEGGATDFVNEGAGMFAEGGTTGEPHKTEYAMGGAIVDYSYGLLSDPTFDINSPIFKSGGKISNKYNYLPKYKIATITTEDGAVIDGNDIIDGIYVKKKVKF